MQVPAFELPACPQVTGKPEVVGSSVGSVPRNALVWSDVANLLVGSEHKLRPR